MIWIEIACDFSVPSNVNQLYVESNVLKNGGKGNWLTRMDFGEIRIRAGVVPIWNFPKSDAPLGDT